MKPLLRLTSVLAAAALLVGTPTAADGQEHMIGLKSGVNFSDIAGPQSFDASTRFHIGGFLQIGVTNALSIRPEIMYTQKGAQNGSVNGYNFTMDFVEMPVLLNYKFVPEGRVHANLFAGPAVALSTKCEVAGTSEAGVAFDQACDHRSRTVDVGDVDVGVVFGGGLTVPFSKVNLLLDARYDWGLLDVNDATGPAAVARCRAFSMSFGFGIPLPAG